MANDTSLLDMLKAYEHYVELSVFSDGSGAISMYFVDDVEVVSAVFDDIEEMTDILLNE